MIPKTIHYCWFGRNPLPDSAVKCINSWRKFFPDYEIKEWNEDNFDVNSIPYTAEAYEMDDILEKGPFMGIEAIGIDVFKTYPLVNPGLGFAAESGMKFFHDVLEHYASLSHLYDFNGNLMGGTVVTHTTSALINYGLQPSSTYQHLAGISIYPADYFNPFDDLTGRLNVTHNTRSIHWYSASWNKRSSCVRLLSRMSHRIFGLYLHRIKNNVISLINK